MRKQQDLSVIWSTEMTFKPTSSKHEAGLTVYLSSQYHNEIGLTQDPSSNKTVIFANTRTGPNATLATTYAEVLNGRTTAKFFIKAEPNQYSLGYSLGEEEPIYIASVANKWLQAFVQGYVRHRKVYRFCKSLEYLLSNAGTKTMLGRTLGFMLLVMNSSCSKLR